MEKVKKLVFGIALFGLACSTTVYPPDRTVEEQIEDAYQAGQREGIRKAQEYFWVKWKLNYNPEDTCCFKEVQPNPRTIDPQNILEFKSAWLRGDSICLQYETGETNCFPLSDEQISLKRRLERAVGIDRFLQKKTKSKKEGME